MLCPLEELLPEAVSLSRANHELTRKTPPVLGQSCRRVGAALPTGCVHLQTMGKVTPIGPTSWDKVVTLWGEQT